MKYSDKLKELVLEYKTKQTKNLSRGNSDIYRELVSSTKFLPEKSTATRRLLHVELDLFEIPKCCVCEKNVSWVNTYKPPRYAKYCSSKCSTNANAVINKRKKSCLEKYGVDSYSKTDEFRTFISGRIQTDEEKEKRIQTVNNFTHEERQNALDKRRSTNKERYGHINVLASDMVKAIKFEKYGTDNYITTDDFAEKRKKTMLSRYGVEYAGESTELLGKTKKTTLSKYGDTSWSRSQISNDSVSKLNDRDWMYTSHIDEKLTLRHMSTLLCVDKKTISTYLLKHGIPITRHPGSMAEREICDMLDAYDVNYRLNDRMVLDNGKELDFLLPDHMIAIEYCGLYWHSTLFPRNTKNYHNEKRLMCEDRGIRLITIFEDEWIHNRTLVETKLVNILGYDDDSIYARKCEISTITQKEKRAFLNKNHIQGDGPSSINISLKYCGIVVAVMGFIKQKNNTFTLNRYSSSTRVVGGFSKMMAYFKRTYEWDSIISFADLRWSDGKLYDKNGWSLDKTLAPDYSYVDFSNQKRIHKFNFRHSKLQAIIGDVYDPSLTEEQNTKNAKWYRIYNCGLQRWIYN